MQLSCHVQEAWDSGTLSAATIFDEFKGDKSITLQIFGKNVQSLQNQTREDELLEELKDLEWDFVVLSETWRPDRQERWFTKEGHMFCGSSGTEGKRGVAILMHCRWKSCFKSFHAISDRICAVDVKIAGCQLRIISTYFPHAGYADEEVEGTYAQLDTAIKEARRMHRTCIILGDWNAVVGPWRNDDDEESVGKYGVGQRNERGNWFVEWTSAQKFMIANTMFEKPVGDQWTHSNGQCKRQIDFCLICCKRKSWVTDAGACEAIGVGIDHRTTNLVLKIPWKKARIRKPNRVKNFRAWKPRDVDAYKEDMDSKLREMVVSCRPEEACQQVEHLLLEGGRKHQTKIVTKQEDEENKKQLRELITRRRLARTRGDRQDVVRSSKLIQKEMRAVAKATKTAKVTQILQDFENLGQLADIRTKGKKNCINSVIDKEGKEVKEAENIADAFADFYESLYKDLAKEDLLKEFSEVNENEVEKITGHEVQVELKKMKKKKAADNAGIVSELLSEGSEKLFELLADIFTAILKPGAQVPRYWASSSIRVLFKKGDPKMPENYRPVCIVPILYKLFSRIICKRIKGILLKEQSWDQAGFREGFSCDDHLFTVTVLAEKSNEFNLPLWVAAIDFAKAFDSISHRSSLEALREHGVPTSYLNVLTRL